MKYSAFIRRKRTGAEETGGGGFTLIEMIMTLAIFALIASVMTPKLNRYLTYWEIENEAHKIAAKIREVQQDAVIQQRPFRLVLNLDDDTYRDERWSGIAWHVFSGEYVVQGQDIDLADTDLPYDSDAGGYVLTYDEFGSTSDVSFPERAEITLSNLDQTRSKIIYVEKITGAVSIQGQ